MIWAVAAEGVQENSMVKKSKVLNGPL